MDRPKSSSWVVGTSAWIARRGGTTTSVYGRSTSFPRVRPLPPSPLCERADVPRADAERYYGFSTFAVQLNETTALENGSIPRTDSRLRPDQLALERGDVDEAEAEKKRVEEKQRAKRKALADAGQEVVPRFFVSDGERWKYDGQYCESSFGRLLGSMLMRLGCAVEKREKHSFGDPDIF